MKVCKDEVMDIKVLMKMRTLFEMRVCEKLYKRLLGLVVKLESTFKSKF